MHPLNVFFKTGFIDMFKSWQDSWLFHLKVASGSGIDDMGTEFEKHIFELISQDCDPGNTYLLFSNSFSIKRIIS